MLDEKNIKKIGESVNKNLGQRFSQFEKKVDQKLEQKFSDFGNHVDGKIDQRFSEFGKQTDQRFLQSEKKFDLQLEKNLKPIKADIAKIRKDVSTLVGFFDSEIVDLRTRVEVIEEILNLKTPNKTS